MEAHGGVLPASRTTLCVCSSSALQLHPGCFSQSSSLLLDLSFRVLVPLPCRRATMEDLCSVLGTDVAE